MFAADLHQECSERAEFYRDLTAKSRITGTIELADLTYTDPEENRVLSDC